VEVKENAMFIMKNRPLLSVLLPIALVLLHAWTAG
jgi:hypothetical protein